MSMPELVLSYCLAHNRTQDRSLKASCVRNDASWCLEHVVEKCKGAGCVVHMRRNMFVENMLTSRSYHELERWVLRSRKLQHWRTQPKVQLNDQSSLFNNMCSICCGTETCGSILMAIMCRIAQSSIRIHVILDCFDHTEGHKSLAKWSLHLVFEKLCSFVT